MNLKTARLILSILASMNILFFFLCFEKIWIIIKFFFNSNFSIHSSEEFELISALIFFMLFTSISIFYLFYYLKLFRVHFFDKIINRFQKSNYEIFTGLILILVLLFLSLTAPILSPFDPAFYKDIAITKLLPPFSEINYVKRNINIDGINEHNLLKKQIFENFEEERRIYFNDLILHDSLVILKKFQSEEKLNLRELETINSMPIIYSQFFLLGTDEFGRDLLSRILYGTRISIFIALLSVIISFLLGSIIGYVAGSYGGIVDALLMRAVDFFLSFPILFFTIFLIAFLGNSLILLIFVFGFSGWMYIARIARNETIILMKKEFVQLLLLAGQKRYKIIIKHILPNSFSPILITIIFLLSNVVIAESALSFLGLGVQPPTPTLGGIIKSGYDYISISWWMTFFGGFVLILIVLAFNSFAEGLKKSKEF